MFSKQQLEDGTEEEDRFLKLPIDVHLNILSRLPLNTISKFRWVSKTWYNFILQIPLGRYSLPCAIFPTHSRHQASYIIDPDSLITHQTTATVHPLHLIQFTQNFTLYDSSISFDVVGVADGMICFSPERCQHRPSPYYICNPITRDYTILPKSPMVDDRHIGSGFGFDSVNNEYKVVRILINSSRDGNVVEVYTLGSGMWRQIQMNLPYIEWMHTPSYVFLYGRLHWISPVLIHSTWCTVILSFDMTSEEFAFIPMPPVPERRGMFKSSYLIVLGDCLCVVDVGGFGKGKGKDVWVLKQYGVHGSWVKEYTFEQEYIFCAWQGFHEVLELGNDQLLLLNKEGVPSYYDCKSRTSRQIELHDIERNPIKLDTSCPIYFKGSLISPKSIEGDQPGSVTERSRENREAKAIAEEGVE